MNEPKYKPTLCVGADVHKDEIVLRAVDKALGHEVLERFRVTNNRPGAQSAAANIAQVAAELGYIRIVDHDLPIGFRGGSRAKEDKEDKGD